MLLRLVEALDERPIRIERIVGRADDNVVLPPTKIPIARSPSAAASPFAIAEEASLRDLAPIGSVARSEPLAGCPAVRFDIPHEPCHAAAPEKNMKKLCV